MFSSKAKRATKAEKERMAKLKEMPCIACVIRGVRQLQPTECHHIVRDNRRVGHQATIGLCGWHHRSELAHWAQTSRNVEATYGPSLSRSSKAFHAAFGSDDELLARTNKLLESL